MSDILSTSSSPLTSTGRVASSRSAPRSATSNSAFMIASGVRRSCEASATKRFWAATLSRMGLSVRRAYSSPPAPTTITMTASTATSCQRSDPSERETNACSDSVSR